MGLLVLALVICIGNRMGPSKIKDQYHARPQKLLKLPESRSDEGNFGDFWGHK